MQIKNTKVLKLNRILQNSIFLCTYDACLVEYLPDYVYSVPINNPFKFDVAQSNKSGTRKLLRE